MAAYLVLFERKLLGRLQIRYGPNRAGNYGLLQPFADTIKMMTKEDIVPAEADRAIFLYAPAVVGITALLMFSVIPFGPDLTLFGHDGHAGGHRPQRGPPLRLRPVLAVRLRHRRSAAGPPTPSTACWAGSAGRPR